MIHLSKLLNMDSSKAERWLAIIAAGHDILKTHSSNRAPCREHCRPHNCSPMSAQSQPLCGYITHTSHAFMSLHRTHKSRLYVATSHTSHAFMSLHHTHKSCLYTATSHLQVMTFCGCTTHTSHAIM